ncbi:MAG: DedA family protein [Alphaproteobacteria bacterium]|nr:DedA family protein [Alphaproteobacteria bacterium]
MLLLLSQIEPLVRHFGLPGLFIDVFLEALGLPLPGETLIIIASGLAGMGQLNIYAIAVTVFIAAVAGDNVGYLIGRKLGRPLIVRYGARFGVTQERLAKVEDLIQKRGPLLVASARFFVVLRQLNGIAAGSAGMHWLKFLVANAIGAALWVGFWTTLAFHFGKDASVLPHFFRHLSVIALFVVGAIVFLLAIGWFLMRRHNRTDP